MAGELLNIGDVIATFSADTSGFQKGLREAGAAVDKMQKNVGDSMKKVGSTMSTAGRKMTTSLTLPIVGAVGASIKTFADFEQQMSNVSTLIAGDASQAVGEFTEGINEMLTRVPKSAEELGASAYSIVSAGISDTGEALKVLEESANLAVGGLGTTEEATDLMTSAINSFAGEGLEANEISDILFKTVKNGKTTVSELAQAFGASAPVLAEAGVKLADFQAATAALTTTGQPASQAQLGLRQAIVALNKPTGEMEKLLDAVGMNGRELIATSDNMGEAFAKVKEKADEQGISWEKAIGSVEALNAVTGITKTVQESYANTLADTRSEVNALLPAVEKQNETTAAQFQIMKNNLNVALREFAVVIMPAAKEAVKTLTEKIKQLSEWWKNLDEDQKKNIVRLLGIVAAAAPAIFIIGKFVTAIGSAVQVVGFLSKALLFLAANPIVLLIAALVGMVAFWIWKWDEIKEGMSVAKDLIVFNVQIIKSKFDWLVIRLKRTLSGVTDAIKEPFRKAFDWIKEKVGGVREALEKINPFHRESPSLVDNVRSGVEAINKEYTKLADVAMSVQPVAAGAGPATAGDRTVNFGDITVRNNEDMRTILEAVDTHLGSQGVTRRFGVAK